MENDIWQVYKDRGLVVLGIDLQESAALVKNWAIQKGLTYTIILDENMTVWNQYGMGYIPHNVIIDHQMIVKYTNYGYDKATLKSIIESSLPTIIEKRLNTPSEELKLLSYPNPFREEITFTIKSEDLKPVRLYVYDILGRRITSIKSDPSRSYPVQLSWDGTDDSGRVVPDGIFFVVMEQGNIRKTSKIIKVR